MRGAVRHGKELDFLMVHPTRVGIFLDVLPEVPEERANRPLDCLHLVFRKLASQVPVFFNLANPYVLHLDEGDLVSPGPCLKGVLPKCLFFRRTTVHSLSAAL